jgi:rhodanese-related sulfurtransferase
MKSLSVRELAAWLADEVRAKPQLVDVREPWEYRICRIEGSLSMPMQSLPARLDELDPERSIVCVCHHGGRSQAVAAFLARHGFADVYNLAGGVDAWAQQVDSKMPTY